jgi:hypothetical protein
MGDLGTAVGRRRLLGGLAAGAAALLSRPAVAQRPGGPITRGIRFRLANRGVRPLAVVYEARPRDGFWDELDRTTVGVGEVDRFASGKSEGRLDMEDGRNPKIRVYAANPFVGPPFAGIVVGGVKLDASNLAEGEEIRGDAADGRRVTVQRLGDSSDYKEFVVEITQPRPGRPRSQ